MKGWSSWWLGVFILGGAAVVGTKVDWVQLRGALTREPPLSSPETKSAIKIIVKNWLERPSKFLEGIGENFWQEIVPLLSNAKVASIRLEEFITNDFACRQLARRLPFISNSKASPVSFRRAVYDLLADNSIQDKVRIIGSIPASWILKDGLEAGAPLIAGVPPYLKALNNDALLTFLENPGGVCNLLTSFILKSFSSVELNAIKPECMAVVKDLETGDLSTIVNYLSDDIFAAYNGALSRETIESMNARKLELYGSFFQDDVTICGKLELRSFIPSTLSSVAAPCLYGYLFERPDNQLGQLWQVIPKKTLLQLTPRMRQVWLRIDAGDFTFLPKEILSILVPNLFVSGQFSTPLELSPGSIQDGGVASTNSLYDALYKSTSNSLILGEMWKNIPMHVMCHFTDSMLVFLKNLAISDFKFMPWWVLQVIIGSDVALANLPTSPSESIKVSLDLNELVLTPQRFAAVAKVAPNLAGQLLLASNGRLPDEIFAYCNGNVIQSLKGNVPGEPLLMDWKYLLGKIKENYPVVFGTIAKLISKRVEPHFCASINTFEEYFSLYWITQNMDGTCHSALKFTLEDVSIFLRAPELGPEILPWKRMMEEYSLQDWKQIASNNSSIPSKLAGTCEFWATASRSKPDIIIAMGPETWRMISPACIKGMAKFLRENVNLIPLFASNAFSMHHAGELEFDLKHLSHSQLVQLSEHVILDADNPTLEEVAQHALHTISLEDLKFLGLEAFIILLPRSIFIPIKVFLEAQSWYLKLASTRLNDFINDRLVEGEKAMPANQQENSSNTKQDNMVIWESVTLALDFYVYICLKSNGKPISCAVDLAALLYKMKVSEFHDQFIECFNQSFMAESFTVALARDERELAKYLKYSLVTMERRKRRFELVFDPKTGFDRVSLLEALYSFPEIFGCSYSYIVSENFVDNGGPMRLLVNQLLDDVKRDLIVAGVTGFSQKFVWGTSSKVGLIVGLAFGKAFQLDIRLPFSLDPSFYNLISDHGDDAVEKYYNSVYEEEIGGYEGYVYSLLDSSDPSSSMDTVRGVITRLDCIRFTKLSSEKNFKKALADPSSKGNLKGFNDDSEGYKDIFDGDIKKFLSLYFQSLRDLALEEFKKYVSKFVKGLSYALLPVRDFHLIPTVALREFGGFLARILNSKPLVSEELIKCITFVQNIEVESLQSGHSVPASKVVTSFITSLCQEELEHLLAIWTGSSTVDLNATSLTVEFIKESDTEPILLDLCEPDKIVDHEDDTRIIAPGQPYRELFGKISQRLVDSPFKIEPECNPGGIPIFLIRVSTCALSLSIVLQPAQKLINSLVDLVNTPITAIRDTQI